MKITLFILTLLYSINAFSQDSLSINITNDLTKAKTTSTEQMFFTVAPRVGFGIHHNLFAEIGIAGIHVNYVPLIWAATSFYGSMIFQQTSNNSSFDTYGFKVGVQSSWNIFMHGLEVKSLFFESNNDIFFSYKLGFALLDAINLEYAVNLLNMPDDMVIQTRNQVSLNFNLNRKLCKEIKKLN